jgi:hypothetical protein
VSNIAQGKVVAIDAIRLHRLNCGDSVEAAVEDETCHMGLVTVLLRHGEGGQAEPTRGIDNHACIVGNRVEIDQMRRGRNGAFLMKADRRREHRRVSVKRFS